MKKKNLLIALIALTLTLFSSCKPTSSSSSVISDDASSQVTTSSSKKEDDLPTTRPEVTTPAVSIHYYRYDGEYSPWCLWLWEDGGDGAIFKFNWKDEYGVVATYALSDIYKDSTDNSMGFIVRDADWNKDVSDDRFIDFKDYTIDNNGIYNIYLVCGNPTVYKSADEAPRVGILTSRFITDKRIKVVVSSDVSKIELYINNELYESQTPVSGVTNYYFDLKEEGQFDADYVVKATFVSDGLEYVKSINKYYLYKTDSFNNKYNYDGELGAIYTKEKTTFRVWSPVSTSIALNLYKNGTPASIKDKDGKSLGDDTVYKTVGMTKGEKGVFEAVVEEDLAGYYYTYVVTRNGLDKAEVVDPYAKSAGVNGLRGMIVDFSATNPLNWDDISYLNIERNHMTVYESHVSDVTSSSTWLGNKANAKLFKGMYEEGTTYSKDGVSVKTGFDHIKELGVNAVQLLPIFDQANDELDMDSFNWGYNPLNYNVLEGKYSSNPFDGYTRIKEFKELVMAYNKAGISIIMDVVYNHVNNAAASNFEALMPGYYFRYDNNDNLYNGSGCGNETASELAMMRKFMIDSTKFWTKEYKLGGFRFDLMGLHDIDTMNELASNLKTINPHIVIYGEPWTGGTSGLSDRLQAKQSNISKFEGYGAFNDKIRDSLIKGGLSGDSEKGWSTSTTAINYSSDLVSGILGKTGGYSSDPNKAVSYVTCHDNYTLYDRAKAAGVEDDVTIKKMAMLSNSIVFTSQGLSFMLAGEEFLRTKGGDHNSYQSSYEVNELDYSLKIKNSDMFNNYQKLISLKQNLSSLAYNSEEDIKNNIDVKVSDYKNVISYTLKDSVNNKEYIVIHSNIETSTESFRSFDLSGYTLYLDTIDSGKTLGANTRLSSYETLIACKTM